MSTDLAVYEKVNDPLAFVREAGTVIAKAKFWGCDNIEQGQALALISLTEGLPMLELRRRYHVIGGDLTMRADFMRAEFRRLGGSYVWKNIGDDGVAAIAVWKYRENEIEVSYSMKDAEREGLVRKGSRWEKAPGDMLRARCTTKAIRMICSEVLAGFCSDEELEHDPPENNGNGNGHKNGSAAKATVVTPAASTTTTTPTAPTAADPNVVDAEIIPPTTDPGLVAARLRIGVLLRELNINPGWDVETLSLDQATKNLKQLEDERRKRLKPETGAATPATTPADSTSAACTAQHADRIKELWGLLSATPEQRDKQLASRNAKTVRNLTMAQASELIGKLEAALEKHSEKQPADSTAADTPDRDLPATAEQCAALRERLKAVAQNYPGIIKTIRGLVEAAGYKSFDDLNYGDVADLLSASYTPEPIPTGRKWPTPKDKRVPF